MDAYLQNRIVKTPPVNQANTLGVICKEVVLAVLHCVDQWDDSTHYVNFVQHSEDHILTEHPCKYQPGLSFQKNKKFKVTFIWPEKQSYESCSNLSDPSHASKDDSHSEELLVNISWQSSAPPLLVVCKICCNKNFWTKKSKKYTFSYYTII